MVKHKCEGQLAWRGNLRKTTLVSLFSLRFAYKQHDFFFFWSLGLVSWQAFISSLDSYETGFYKPTVLKVHLPFLEDYSICNNARLISTQFLLPYFEWCMKNGLHSGGLNPRPLSHESSAITTRPRLLT